MSNLRTPLRLGTAGLLAVALALPIAASAGSNFKSSLNGPRGQWWARTPLQGAELVVRPDALRMSFSLTQVKDDPEAALAGIEAVAALVQTRFGDVRGAKAVVELTATDVGVWTDDKGKNATPLVNVRGEVELPLPADADLLQRARWLTSMVKLRDQLAHDHGDARKGVHFVGYGPTPVVLEPEAHRAALLGQWAKRMQEFVAAAQTAGTPLAVVDCRAPGAVQTVPLSLDAMKLSMALECRVDAARAASAPSSR